MIFQKKLDKAMKKLHENSDSGRMGRGAGEEEFFAESTFFGEGKKVRKEEKFEEERPKLEKNDALAMLIAAFLTILPVALLVLGGIALLGWFFLMR